MPGIHILTIDRSRKVATTAEGERVPVTQWIVRGGEDIACIVGPVLGSEPPWHLIEGEAFADAVYDA